MEIVRPGFIYTVEHIGIDGKVKSRERVKNIMPTVALEYMLGTTFKGASQFTSFYASLFTANRTPVAADTMTTLLADCVEDTVYTVTGGARKLITLPAIADAAISIVASAPTVNVFEFTASATIRGAFITTNITRGNNAGLLLSAVLFDVPKPMVAGEGLRLPLGFALSAV